MLSHKRFVAGLLAIVAALTLFGIYYGQRPAYNWDMIPYIAVALRDTGVPSDALHQKTYDALATVPEPARTRFVEGRFPSNVAKNPSIFLAQIPLYSVKPLYPALMSILYRAGVNIVSASIVVPVSAYIGIGILLFIWFSRWIAPISVTALLVILISLSPFLTTFARFATPDTLSALLIVFATYLIWERGRDFLGAAVLVLSVTARPDSIVCVWWTACFLLLARRIGIMRFSLFLGAGILVYSWEAWVSGNYGWKVLMYYEFVDHNMDFRNFSPLGIGDYINIYVRGLDQLVFFGEYFATYLLIGFVTFYMRMKRAQVWYRDQYVNLVGIAISCVVSRVIIFPTEFSRGFLPYYLILLVAFIGACCSEWGRIASPPTTPLRAAG